MTPEGHVKKKVNEFLDMFGNDMYRFMAVQTGYGSPTLDYLVCIRGHFIAIETKRVGKKPTPRQETTIERINSAGGHTFVIDGPDTLALACREILELVYGKGSNTTWPTQFTKVLLPQETLSGESRRGTSTTHVRRRPSTSV